MPFTSTLEAWIFILREEDDEAYPLDLGKSPNNDSTNDMTFNASPQFQLWSSPDSYDFIGAGDVTINSEPSGTVPPGSDYSYDLTVDLTNIPANQVHLALRPVDNNLFGSIGPTYSSVVSSTVTFTP